KSWSFRTRQRRLGPRTIPCTHRCKRRSLQAAVELRGREKRARRLQDLVRPHQLRHFLAQGPDLLALGGGHARLLSSVDARPVHPAAHSVGRDPSQVMQVPQRRPHRLARHLLPPLVEHPDEPVLRLLVVLGSHASFSPFAWKESLHQTQCGSLVELLSSLYAPDGTVAVAGFYDDVVPLTDEERAMIARTDLSEAQLLEATG